MALQTDPLRLYSTEHCHLCEQALELLLAMPELVGWTLEVVDVAADADLIETYGERIPVLQLAGRELNWPFDRSAVLRHCGLR